jgi:hypothetical protein
MPSSLKIAEESIIKPCELQYSAYFDDDKKLFRGYIQLWRLNDTEKFLAKSKEMSSYDFSSYTLAPVTVGTLNGILSIWSASFGKSSMISGQEYWLNKPDSNEVLRISFLTSNDTFKKEQAIMINQILNSIRWGIHE